jgi:hypothetical protein
MDIPLNVDVYCSDEEVCGRSVSIILNPVTQKVTHFVIQTEGFVHLEYMIPIEFIVESTPYKIQLRCSRKQLGFFGNIRGTPKYGDGVEWKSFSQTE